MRRVIFVAAIAAAILALPRSSPFTMLGGDTVEPKVVRASDTITVSRNFKTRGEQQALVIRTIVKGDCAVSCDILPLANEETLFKGDKLNSRKEHVLPARMTPGIWRLVFYIRTTDIFGRHVITYLPELEIEVFK